MTESMFLYDSHQLQGFASCALERARSLGASSAVVRVSEESNINVSVLHGQIDVIRRQRSKQIAITVYAQGRRGSSTSADLSRTAIEAATEFACEIASFTAADPCAGPVEAEHLARASRDLELFHPWDISPDDAVGLAAEIEAAALAARPMLLKGGEISPPMHQLASRLTSGGSSVSTQHSQFVLATSLGFVDGYRQSAHSLDCSVIAADDTGMQNGSWSSTHRSAAHLEGVSSIGHAAAERAVAQLSPTRLRTMRSPVLFEATVAASLIGTLLGAITGEAQYRRRSFLLDARGTRVMAEHLTLGERPSLVMGLASAPFDREGVATLDVDIVRAGVLQTYLLDSYSSRKLGLPLTGHAGGARNVQLRSQLTRREDDFSAMVRTLGTGLVVTRMLGGGVNPITGDYSQGVAGLWVEGGEVRHATQEITVAGNLRDMLNGIVAVGSDQFVRGAAIKTGSILIDQLQIAGL
jgi:PmbA protein